VYRNPYYLYDGTNRFPFIKFRRIGSFYVFLLSSILANIKFALWFTVAVYYIYKYIRRLVNNNIQSPFDRQYNRVRIINMYNPPPIHKCIIREYITYTINTSPIRGLSSKSIPRNTHTCRHRRHPSRGIFIYRIISAIFRQIYLI